LCLICWILIRCVLFTSFSLWPLLFNPIYFVNFVDPVFDWFNAIVSGFQRVTIGCSLVRVFTFFVLMFLFCGKSLNSLFFFGYQKQRWVRTSPRAGSGISRRLCWCSLAQVYLIQIVLFENVFVIDVLFSVCVSDPISESSVIQIGPLCRLCWAQRES
jgi:hypothetical protein